MYLDIHFYTTNKETLSRFYSKHVFLILGMLCAFMLSMMSTTAQAQSDNDNYFWNTMRNPKKEAIDSTILQGMTPNAFYVVRLYDNKGCGLQWGHVVYENERNAKFDCSSEGDDLVLRIIPRSEGTSEVEGLLYAIGPNSNKMCGLQWDIKLTEYNERNAKFDCGDEGPSVMKITASGNDMFTIQTIAPKNGDKCKLQWDSRVINDNEHNAKFDCTSNKGDPVKIVRLMDQLT